MADESDVLLNTGQNARTIEVNRVVDGAVTTLEQQVVSIADADGTLQDFGSRAFQDAVLCELREIRRILAKLANEPFYERI